MKPLLIFLLVIGLVIRLVVATTAIHPDFRAVNLAADFITNGEVFTFYDHISHLPRTDWLVQLYHDDLFIYPPLAYLFHAVFHLLLSPLYPPAEWSTLINDIGQLRSLPHTPLLLFLLKLPYLLVDLVGLLVITKFFTSSKARLSALAFWWLNPVSIYVTYGIGQFDLLIAFNLLLALLLSGKKPALSALFIGLAAGFKPFPLALLPFLPGNKIKNLLVGGLTYALIILPYLPSPAFKMYALLADQSSKLFFAKVYVTSTQYVSLFIVGFALILALHFLKPRLVSTYGWFSVILLMFYSFSSFHPQWFIWIIPALLFIWVNHARLRSVIVALIVCYFGIVLSFEPSLHFGLWGLNFSPYALLPALIPPDQFVSWLRSLLTAASVYLFVKLIHSHLPAHEN